MMTKELYYSLCLIKIKVIVGGLKVFLRISITYYKLILDEVRYGYIIVSYRKLRFKLYI